MHALCSRHPPKCRALKHILDVKFKMKRILFLVVITICSLSWWLFFTFFLRSVLWNFVNIKRVQGEKLKLRMLENACCDFSS